MATVLEMAGKADLAVAQAAAAQVVSVPLPAAGSKVGTVELVGRHVPVATGTTGTLLAWPGQAVKQSTVVTKPHPKAGSKAGNQVGAFTYRLAQQQVTIPAVTTGRLPKVG
jgi:hypothetical protein